MLVRDDLLFVSRFLLSRLDYTFCGAIIAPLFEHVLICKEQQVQDVRPLNYKLSFKL